MLGTVAVHEQDGHPWASFVILAVPPKPSLLFSCSLFLLTFKAHFHLQNLLAVIGTDQYLFNRFLFYIKKPKPASVDCNQELY